MTFQKEMKALERTYYHRMNIERVVKVTNDGLTKGSKLQVVGQNIPCALSFSKLSRNTAQSNGPNMIEYAAVLFCNPAITVLPGDILRVTLENGQVRFMQAGESIPYPTHQQVPCSRKEGA
ncbi:hypothetical protein BP422_13105 [Brevibacillus formosus]|uniref:Uncharacterized protein n=1 Tax=Brevibacillus formosus TaxID=54913 RepID=A0A220MHV5_9BACL|nr:hypothetical protein [Brevibacillus formosus]ASJ54412.1 hypothetical protein BP422_13105 [Brevibacillus formosus]